VTDKDRKELIRLLSIMKENMSAMCLENDANGE